MVLLGQLQAFSISEDQVHRWPYLAGTERKKLYCNYSHHGKPVCLKFFLLVNAIGKKRMRNLMIHSQENGIVARIHGNVHRCPKHSLSLDDIESVVRFFLSNMGFSFLAEFLVRVEVTSSFCHPVHLKEELEMIQKCCSISNNTNGYLQSILQTVERATTIHHRDEAHV